MAQQQNIRYVSLYVDGSAAKKIQQPEVQKAAAPKPKYQRAKYRILRIDPVAVVGIVLSVVMLAAMVLGLQQYEDCLQRQQQMDVYLQQLQEENLQLEKTYEDGYDLEEIRKIAEAMGMVPAESVEQFSVEVNLPEQPAQPEPTLWETAITFLAGLFA